MATENIKLKELIKSARNVVTIRNATSKGNISTHNFDDPHELGIFKVGEEFREEWENRWFGKATEFEDSGFIANLSNNITKNKK